MPADMDRSEAVIEDYKKRKLAASALRRIHDLIHGFEQDRVVDMRLARIGITIILLLLGAAAFFFLNSDSMTLS